MLAKRKTLPDGGGVVWQTADGRFDALERGSAVRVCDLRGWTAGRGMTTTPVYVKSIAEAEAWIARRMAEPAA